MTEYIKRLVPALLRAAVCVYFGAVTTLAGAGLVEEEIPRLSSGDNTLESSSLTSPGRLAGHRDSSIIGLRHSIQQLVGGRVSGSSSLEDQSSVGDQVQRALRRLSAGVPSSFDFAGPRIVAGVEGPPSKLGTIAGVESQLAQIRGLASDPDPARQVAGLKTLQRAMQRFERASGVVPSSTFARVYIGLDSKVPMLSNTAAKHASVPTRDLRARVVEARTAAAASSLMPSLVTAASGLRLGDVDLPASASTELADLVGPLDQVALSDLSGRSETLAHRPARDDLERAIDEIELEDLGVGLASAEAPVGVDQLQDTRAGFLLDNGIRVDFSITRTTLIDGLDQQQAQDLAANMPIGLNPEALTQIASGQGGNTRVLTPADGSSAFTVIQNTLDNQSILDVTTFNIDIQGAGLRSLDFVPQSFLPEALPPEVR